MSEHKVTITDDGDEKVFFAVDGAVVAEVSHGPHGWDGMTGAIDAVEQVARALGAEVQNSQDVV